MKKYKALMLDLDGTTIPNSRTGMPSEKVINAISKASKIIHIGIATARPLFMISEIIEKLELSAPLIIDSGAEIIDSRTRKTLHEQSIDKKDVVYLCRFLEKMNIDFMIHDQGEDIQYTKSYNPKKPTAMFIIDLKNEDADILIRNISDIPTISISKTVSWVEGKVGILISHSLATKQHGIFEVAKILGIETHEIIGVGDGYNDFPLLMACGLKIAMGNAVPELKEIADYIAPSVEEDGVAWVIEKFVLGKNS